MNWSNNNNSNRGGVSCDDASHSSARRSLLRRGTSVGGCKNKELVVDPKDLDGLTSFPSGFVPNEGGVAAQFRTLQTRQKSVPNLHLDSSCSSSNNNCCDQDGASPSSNCATKKMDPKSYARMIDAKIQANSHVYTNDLLRNAARKTTQKNFSVSRLGSTFCNVAPAINLTAKDALTATTEACTNSGETSSPVSRPKPVATTCVSVKKTISSLNNHHHHHVNKPTLPISSSKSGANTNLSSRYYTPPQSAPNNSNTPAPTTLRTATSEPLMNSLDVTNAVSNVEAKPVAISATTTTATVVTPTLSTLTSDNRLDSARDLARQIDARVRANANAYTNDLLRQAGTTPSAAVSAPRMPVRNKSVGQQLCNYKEESTNINKNENINNNYVYNEGVDQQVSLPLPQQQHYYNRRTLPQVSEKNMFVLDLQEEELLHLAMERSLNDDNDSFDASTITSYNTNWSNTYDNDNVGFNHNNNYSNNNHRPSTFNQYQQRYEQPQTAKEREMIEWAIQRSLQENEQQQQQHQMPPISIEIIRQRQEQKHQYFDYGYHNNNETAEERLARMEQDILELAMEQSLQESNNNNNDNDNIKPSTRTQSRSHRAISSRYGG